MYYPYCTIGYMQGGEIEVIHTPYKNGCTVVHFEQPDAVYCFKTLDVVIPSYKITSRVGFNDDEVAQLIEFCKNNASLLIKYSQEGGIANA